MPIRTNVASTKVVLPVVNGTEEANVLSDLTIQPNPASDILYFISDQNLEKAEILDALGRSVLVSRIQDRQVNIVQLPQGTYFVKVFAKEGVAVRKLEKK